MLVAAPGPGQPSSRCSSIWPTTRQEGARRGSLRSRAYGEARGKAGTRPPAARHTVGGDHRRHPGHRRRGLRHSPRQAHSHAANAVRRRARSLGDDRPPARSADPRSRDGWGTHINGYRLGRGEQPAIVNPGRADGAAQPSSVTNSAPSAPPESAMTHAARRSTPPASASAFSRAAWSSCCSATFQDIRRKRS
jgi:hypothetical protein